MPNSLHVAARRRLACLALVALSGCYLAHEPETGIPITVLTAGLNHLQLPVTEPQPAEGAWVRAERCVDGAVVEARVKADGRAFIDFGDGLEFDCWTVTAVSLEGRPTAVTLVRAEAPLPAPVLLDRTMGPNPDWRFDRVALEISVGSRSAPDSGVTFHGRRVDVSGRGWGFGPITGDSFVVELEREDVLAEDTLFAIEWLAGVPINAATFTLGSMEADVVRATIEFPATPARIHRATLPFTLPDSGLFPFGPLALEVEEGWWWGTGGFVWGVRSNGGTSAVGQLLFEYDEANSPPWTVEAVWPDLPWTQIFAHEPRMGFVFVSGPADEEDGTHGFVDGPIEDGSHLVVPPIRRASIAGSLPGEIAVDVGGEGHVGFVWLQGGDDVFTEYARYRIYSAPHEPLVLDAWPTLPGGLEIEDLDLEGEREIRATIGVSDPHGNPGWMVLPLREERGRRLFVGALVD